MTNSFGLPDRLGAITLSIRLAGIRAMEERESRDLFGRRPTRRSSWSTRRPARLAR